MFTVWVTPNAPLAPPPTSDPAAAGARRIGDHTSTTGYDETSPDEVALVSGDAIALDLRIARLGSRALARMIDIVIQLVGVYILGLLVSFLVLLAGGSDAALFDAISIIVFVTVFLGYPIAMQTLARGRTVGKFVLGLRVLRDDGGPIGFRHAFTRELVGFAAELPGLFPPFTILAGLWAMVAGRHAKRLGDLTAGTIVIHTRTPIVWSWAPIMPPYLAGWATTLDLTAVPDDLALAIRQFLLRYRELDPVPRGRLGADLTRDLIGRLTPLPPAGSRAYDVLAAVLAERHARSVRRLGQARAATALVWPELSAVLRPVVAYPPGPPIVPVFVGTPGMRAAAGAPGVQPAVPAPRAAVPPDGPAR